MSSSGENSPPIGSITQGAGSAFSNNQQGGITAGTYVASPQLWKLSTRDVDTLTAKFAQLGIPWCVVSTATESDSKDLGKQICNAAKARCESTDNMPSIAGAAHVWNVMQIARQT